MIDPKGKPYIVELNSKPGILMIPELEKRTYENLVNFLKNHIN
jgi:hypothetical protein